MTEVMQATFDQNTGAFQSKVYDGRLKKLAVNDLDLDFEDVPCFYCFKNGCLVERCDDMEFFILDFNRRLNGEK